MSNNTKIPFIIDCQVFQSNTFFRGMGRYSKLLLSNLFSDKDFSQKYSVYLLINSKLNTDSERFKELYEVCPNAQKISYNPPQFGCKNINENLPVIKKYLTSILKQSNINLENSFFLILSNFEADKSLSVFPDLKINKLILLYDIIPHIFSKTYLIGNDEATECYYSRYGNIFEADRIFSISETTKDDLTNFLGISIDKITNINGALISQVNKKTTKLSNSNLEENNKIILCPSGDDLRKNNENLIRAFCEFDKKVDGSKYELLITSKFSEDSKNKLLELASQLNQNAKITFTGNISDNELNELYKRSEFVIFIPLYEGLGLPILEAVSYNKKIIASNILVFKEISRTAFSYCNQTDVSSITNSMIEVAHDSKISISEAKEYEEINKKYTWENSVKSVTQVLKTMTKDKTLSIIPEKKLKVALFGPDLFGYSAISKYIEEIYPSLLEKADIDYYFNSGASHKKNRESYIPYFANYFNIDDFSSEKYREYDLVIYNMGNSEYHTEIYKKAMLYPGIVIIHDISIQNFFQFAKDNFFLKESRYQLEKVIDPDYFIKSLINSSLGIVVHSKFALDASAERLMFDIPITKINLPATFTLVDKSENKKIHLGLGGIMDRVKGLFYFIDLAKELNIRYPGKLKFSVFGYDLINNKEKCKELIQGEDIDLEFKIDLSDYEYDRQLKELDLMLCYRIKYSGETSKTLLDAAKNGVASIVRDIGWFSELPNDMSVKTNNYEEILKSTIKLIDSPDSIKKLGECAKKFTNEECTPIKYVETLFEFSNKCKTNKENPNLLIKQQYNSTDILTVDKLNEIYGKFYKD
ncbi:MAG: glycosyltransferase [bacterium]